MAFAALNVLCEWGGRNLLQLVTCKHWCDGISYNSYSNTNPHVKFGEFLACCSVFRQAVFSHEVVHDFVKKVARLFCYCPDLNGWEANGKIIKKIHFS